MNKRTKLILSIIGISAIIIPAVLLKLLSFNIKEPSKVSKDNRSLDTKAVQEAVKKVPGAERVSPEPSPASPSARPATSSASPQ